MSKKTTFFLLIGMLFLSISYYSSAAHVKPDLEREVQITLESQEEDHLPEEKEEPVSMHPTNQQFVFEEADTHWHVLTLVNHEDTVQTIDLQIHLNPLINGNHWEFELYTKPQIISDQFNHQRTASSQTFAIPGETSVQVFVRSLQKPNNAGKEAPIDITYELITLHQSTQINQSYHFNY